jgi:hypothetical protein
MKEKKRMKIVRDLATKYPFTEEEIIQCRIYCGVDIPILYVILDRVMELGLSLTQFNRLVALGAIDVKMLLRDTKIECDHKVEVIVPIEMQDMILSLISNRNTVNYELSADADEFCSMDDGYCHTVIKGQTHTVSWYVKR